MKGTAVPILALAMAWLPAGAAGHAIDVESFGEGGDLVIQVWTGDDYAAGAEIEILQENGELVVSGRADENGMFRWTPTRAIPLTVNVYAEAGHETEFTVEAGAVQAIMDGAAGGGDAGASAEAAGPDPGAEAEPVARTAVYSSQQQLQQGIRILAGFTFILALAAAWLGWQNRKRIQRLEDRLNGRGIRD